MITCNKDNVAFAGVAKANGGVLTKEHWHPPEPPCHSGCFEQRYWIDLGWAGTDDLSAHASSIPTASSEEGRGNADPPPAAGGLIDGVDNERHTDRGFAGDGDAALAEGRGVELANELLTNHTAVGG